jgi:hypothetical protein
MNKLKIPFYLILILLTNFLLEKLNKTILLDSFFLKKSFRQLVTAL